MLVADSKKLGHKSISNAVLIQIHTPTSAGQAVPRYAFLSIALILFLPRETCLERFLVKFLRGLQMLPCEHKHGQRSGLAERHAVRTAKTTWLLFYDNPFIWQRDSHAHRGAVVNVRIASQLFRQWRYVSGHLFARQVDRRIRSEQCETALAFV